MGSEWLLTLQISLGSRYNSFGTLKRRSRKEAIHCFHGSVYIQEGDTAESFKVLINTFKFFYDEKQSFPRCSI